RRSSEKRSWPRLPGTCMQGATNRWRERARVRRSIMTQTLPPRTERPGGAAQAESTAAGSPDTRFVMPGTCIPTLEADGIRVFYREAGPSDGAVVLLLHGFPASSFVFRELIPRLADRYRVIAPDLPGLGFTEVPPARNYLYSFDALARTIAAFTEAL